MKTYGGDGDDKIIMGGGFLEIVEGGDGNDTIYGTEIDLDFQAPVSTAIYGDINAINLLADPSLAPIGGDDKIYGGDGLANQRIYAGPGNDLVTVGSNGNGPLFVNGDNFI